MKETKKRSVFFRHSFTAYILFLCFSVSLASLIVYFLEPDYSDSRLFLLLIIIRYSSFFVIVCSFYKIVLNFYRIIKHKQKISIVKIIIYLALMIYGACAFLFEAFIVVISRGTV